MNEWLKVESLDLEAQGVAHNLEGKVVFIDGALPGEEVQVTVQRRKNNWEQATMVALRRESSQRVRPRCRALRHLRRLQDAALPRRRRRWPPSSARWRTRCGTWARSRPSSCCGRSKARPGATATARGCRCAIVAKKGKVLVGFHERKSQLRGRHGQLRGAAAARQRAAAAAARAGRRAWTSATACRRSRWRWATTVTALVLRHLEPLSDADRRACARLPPSMACSGGCSRRGRTPCSRWTTGGPALAYSLPEFGITMPFKPTDFTQVNHADQPRAGGARAAPAGRAADERVIDWFCGLGNFTLPIATQAREVLGIEGSEALVQRSRENAALNGLAGTTTLRRAQPVRDDAADLVAYGQADKWLVDPPREGAFALAKALAELHADAALAPDWRCRRSASST